MQWVEWIQDWTENPLLPLLTLLHSCFDFSLDFSGVFFFTVLLRYPLAINSLIQSIGSEREVQEGGDICISMADSC